MLTEQPLDVPFSNPENMSNGLSAPPLLHGQRTHWQNMMLLSYDRIKSWETPVHISSEHLLLLHNSLTKRVERRINDCGFSSQSHLARPVFGVTPRAYRGNG